MLKKTMTIVGDLFVFELFCTGKRCRHGCDFFDSYPREIGSEDSGAGNEWMNEFFIIIIIIIFPKWKRRLGWYFILRILSELLDLGNLRKSDPYLGRAIHGWLVFWSVWWVGLSSSLAKYKQPMDCSHGDVVFFSLSPFQLQIWASILNYVLFYHFRKKKLMNTTNLIVNSSNFELILWINFITFTRIINLLKSINENLRVGGLKMEATSASVCIKHDWTRSSAKRSE